MYIETTYCTYPLQVRGGVVLPMRVHVLQRRRRRDLREDGEDELVGHLHQVLHVHHQRGRHVRPEALDSKE